MPDRALPGPAAPPALPRTIRTVRAAEVLLAGELVPAVLHLDGGRIRRIERLDGADATVATGGAVGPSAPPGEELRVPDGVRVLPGNVDTHVHINEPGRTEWEGFATATTAAALGGVTTLVDMPLNSVPPTVDLPALRVKQAAARDALRVDLGFWGGIVPGNTGALEGLWDAGVRGFKCFLLPSGVDEFPPVDARQLREAMREVARFDGLVIVHAEDARTIAQAPAVPSASYTDFVASRPDAAEVTAIAGLIEAIRETGARTHLLHLSSARALDLIASARAEGLPLTVETCPHYLCFDAASVPDAAPEFKCCPPIRDSGNRDALWQGLQEGLIDTVVTDHSPSTAEEKHRGAPDLQQAWGGISGLQAGFTAVAAHAQERGVGIAQVSRWMATATADLVGLPAKGRIAEGADADLVLHDPRPARTLRAAELVHRNPISAYDGMALHGEVTTTILRGDVIAQGGRVAAPQGRFLTGRGGAAA
ncbi:allantoinase AllB [Brachybacterium squillarum]|uniref:allantoinase AllB n=1 Tax=Brachybacterium squillarum TaxID=661979 RepID=UPI002223D007|nr:allantoinase AllB [Brachybacterium squillarum]MCW1806248.1 allantoinase AllB [Brachybacterium squillarum]